MATIQVRVRLFGLRGGDSQLTRLPTQVPVGFTVRGLLDRLRSQASPGDRLASVAPGALLALVNGRPIQHLQGWETRLEEHDEISFLLKTAGG